MASFTVAHEGLVQCFNGRVPPAEPAKTKAGRSFWGEGCVAGVEHHVAARLDLGREPSLDSVGDVLAGVDGELHAGGFDPAEDLVPGSVAVGAGVPLGLLLRLREGGLVHADLDPTEREDDGHSGPDGESGPVDGVDVLDPEELRSDSDLWGFHFAPLFGAG